MNLADWFLAAMGAIVIACGIFAIVVSCWFWWKEKAGKTHEPSFQKGVDCERCRLCSAAYWFSECPVTFHLIRGLSKGIAVDTVRERWRKARSESSAPAATNQKEN